MDIAAIRTTIENTTRALTEQPEKARLGAEGVSAKELREIAAWGDAHSPVACGLRMPPAITTEVEIVR